MENKTDEIKSTSQNFSRGRPKKNPETVKTAYLGFRVPEEEIKAIEAAAVAAGESVSEYVRKAVADRMESHKQVVPAASVSYAIPSMKIIDSKSSDFQSRTYVVKAYAHNKIIHPADDNTSHE